MAACYNDEYGRYYLDTNINTHTTHHVQTSNTNSKIFLLHA